MLTFLKASLVGAKLTQFTVDSALFKNLNHFSLNNTVSAIVEFISHHMAPDVFPFYFLLILFISFSGTYTFQFSTSPPLFGRGSKFLLTKLSWAKNLCGHCLQNRWGEFYFVSGCVGWLNGLNVRLYDLLWKMPSQLHQHDSVKTVLRFLVEYLFVSTVSLTLKSAAPAYYYSFEVVSARCLWGSIST